MRIGFITPYDTDRIAFARNNGFGCVELKTDRPSHPCDFLPGAKGWQDKASEVKAAFDEADLGISCVAGFYMNHLDPKKKKEGRELVRNVILLAEYMGVDTVAGFAGRIDSPNLADSIPAFTEVWTEHAAFAQEHGVRIALETCPIGQFHTPCGGMNCIATPEMYRRCLDAVDSPALGLEWDPSHLVCQFVDPVVNIREIGERIYHVHAKGAKVNWHNVRRFGLWHPKSIEHCHPGFGDEDWAQIIKELRRAGYHGDLNIEGWHDAVYRDPVPAPDDIHIDPTAPQPPALEDYGLVIAKRHLERYCVEVA